MKEENFLNELREMQIVELTNNVASLIRCIEGCVMEGMGTGCLLGSQDWDGGLHGKGQARKGQGTSWAHGFQPKSGTQNEGPF